MSNIFASELDSVCGEYQNFLQDCEWLDSQTIKELELCFSERFEVLGITETIAKHHKVRLKKS